jgi:hypothetical protein
MCCCGPSGHQRVFDQPATEFCCTSQAQGTELPFAYGKVTQVGTNRNRGDGTSSAFRAGTRSKRLAGHFGIPPFCREDGVIGVHSFDFT